MKSPEVQATCQRYTIPPPPTRPSSRFPTCAALSHTKTPTSSTLNLSQASRVFGDDALAHVGKAESQPGVLMFRASAGEGEKGAASRFSVLEAEHKRVHNSVQHTDSGYSLKSHPLQCSTGCCQVFVKGFRENSECSELAINSSPWEDPSRESRVLGSCGASVTTAAMQNLRSSNEPFHPNCAAPQAPTKVPLFFHSTLGQNFTSEASAVV